ncbi:hypothetical protein JHK87_027924 [Glycine soja]|nr:hypothetical protein JHK87_027924 [Glycine soja]
MLPIFAGVWKGADFRTTNDTKIFCVYIMRSFWAALSFIFLFADPTPELPTPSFEYHTAFDGVALGIVCVGMILYFTVKNVKIEGLVTSMPKFDSRIICGKCLNGQCKGCPGCICNVTNESNYRVLVDLAIPCDRLGPPVFQGITVGFHPRSWELLPVPSHIDLPCRRSIPIIAFGSQVRTEQNKTYSFHIGQTQVVLFMTAIASLSSLVQKPSLKVLPDKGLEVGLSGSAAKGKPPIMLSPSMLIVDWRCEVVRNTPYEVNNTIPVEG